MVSNRLPGWEADSWGYHGDDGHSFCCQGTGQPYGPKFTTGDVVGCAINFASGECFYTKNGVHLGVAFTGLTGDLYPSVGLKTVGEQVRVNFGTMPFVFDIDYFYRQEKLRLYKSVRDEEDDVSDRVQGLVSAYLSHNGYVESAMAMASDISTQTNNAANFPTIDMEASNRQRIRSFVLDGDMDSALEMLERLFPEVLKNHESLLFRIRCRKFVEMLRICADMQAQKETSNNHTASAPTETDVSIEDIAMKNSSVDSNAKSMTDEQVARIDETLQKAVQYGQSLQSLYADPSNTLYTAGLKETFSLLAYPDPRNSPEVSHLFDASIRNQIAEDINRAILISSGRSARSELEEIVACVGMKVSSVKGAEFINVQRDFLCDI